MIDIDVVATTDQRYFLCFLAVPLIAVANNYKNIKNIKNMQNMQNLHTEFARG